MAWADPLYCLQRARLRAARPSESRQLKLKC